MLINKNAKVFLFLFSLKQLLKHNSGFYFSTLALHLYLEGDGTEMNYSEYRDLSLMAF